MFPVLEKIAYAMDANRATPKMADPHGSAILRFRDHRSRGFSYCVSAITDRMGSQIPASLVLVVLLVAVLGVVVVFVVW